MKHRILKIIAMWNADEQEYGVVYVHAEYCPACVVGGLLEP